MTPFGAPGRVGRPRLAPARPPRSRGPCQRTAAFARSRLARLIWAAARVTGQVGVLVAVLVAALMVCTALAPTPPRRNLPASAEGLAPALEDMLRSYLAWRPLVPGAALSVTAPGMHAEVAAGRRSLPGVLPGARLSPADPFRSASVTKTFTAAAVLRLVETGALGLDDPIVRHLPPDLSGRLVVCDVEGARASCLRRISVRQLLNHTSGIYDYGTDPGWLARVAVSPHRVWAPLELIEHANTHGEPYAEAGREFHYSDTGYVLLALVLEHLTGRPLARAYRALLPMHLVPGTWLEGREPPPAGARQRASQYTGPLELTGYHPSYDNFGGGGLVTTVADLDAFTHALFTGAVFTHPDTLTTMLTTGHDGRSDAYGLGIGRRTLAGQTVWLHTGFLGGALAYVPRLHLSLAVTTNQTLAAPDPLITAAIELTRPLIDASV